eukprot:3811372-Pleurochrysis_carterae.AAC.1
MFAGRAARPGRKRGGGVVNARGGGAAAAGENRCAEPACWMQERELAACHAVEPRDAGRIGHPLPAQIQQLRVAYRSLSLFHPPSPSQTACSVAPLQVFSPVRTFGFSLWRATPDFVQGSRPCLRSRFPYENTHLFLTLRVLSSHATDF